MTEAAAPTRARDETVSVADPAARLNVLVFPCGSEIGLEIHAALKFSKDIRLLGASSVSDHGEFVYARYRHIQADTRSEDFIEQLNTLIEAWSIDVVMPAHDSVIPLLAQAGSRLRALAIVPDAETAACCRNKRLTYARLQGLGIVPVEIDTSAAAYPIFAKPAIGQGSQGAQRVDDSNHYRSLVESGIDYVFSQYLPGDEYTVDCISDAQGHLVHTSPRIRSRVKSGISVRTESVAEDPAIVAMAHAIAGELRLKGAWFFQVKRDAEGAPKLLEVAPRIAGSMGLSRAHGINYPLLSIYAHLGRAFSVMPQAYPLIMDRALGNRYRTTLRYECAYIDLDDTLIVNGAINLTLLSLLYQCVANGIKLVLVTRHARCPRETLASHRICAELFDQIVHLQDGTPKSTVIKPGSSSIFIDDSFRERRDVLETTGVPVFDVDAIEQLLDGRA